MATDPSAAHAANLAGPTHPCAAVRRRVPRLRRRVDHQRRAAAHPRIAAASRCRACSGYRRRTCSPTAASCCSVGGSPTCSAAATSCSSARSLVAIGLTGRRIRRRRGRVRRGPARPGPRRGAHAAGGAVDPDHHLHGRPRPSVCARRLGRRRGPGVRGRDPARRRADRGPRLALGHVRQPDRLRARDPGSRPARCRAICPSARTVRFDVARKRLAHRRDGCCWSSRSSRRPIRAGARRRTWLELAGAVRCWPRSW